MRVAWWALGLWSGILGVEAGAAAPAMTVPRFARFTQSFEAGRAYANPYVEVNAEADIRRPGGGHWTLPLFWDGGGTWRLRISPDQVGLWSYTVRANDSGLDGRRGRFRCVPSSLRGGLRIMPGHGHHFATQDGRPFLFWGDTAWSLFVSCAAEGVDRTAVLRYIAKRAREGVTVIHAMLLSEAGWGNEGGDPFTDLRHEVLNPAYWREVDRRLAALNEAGVIGGLVLGWGDKGRGEPWAWRSFPSETARRRYARYVAARYGAFAVYFLVSGEWNAEIRRRHSTEEAVRRSFVALGDALAAADPHDRLIGIHPMTQEGSVREFRAADWMGFGDYQQNYADLHARILRSRGTDRPVVNGEYGYFLRDADGDGRVDKHNSLSVSDMRFATWDILMAGGYPVTGYGTTYMGGYRDPGPFAPDEARNEAWTQCYQAARRLWATLPWWTLEPRDEAIDAAGTPTEDRTVWVADASGRRRRLRRAPESVVWLLADPGRLYVAYGRGIDGPVTLRLGPQATGTYRIEAAEPATGQRGVVAASATVEGTYRFTPVSRGDWVRILRRR